MRTLLLAFIAVPLLGACVATVRPGPSSGPPPPPPERRHRPDRDHDHDRDRRPDGPRFIEGTVRDAVTGRPIDRAGVDITGAGIQGEMTVQTGPDGRFRTGEIPRGEFAIRCRREGYESINRVARMSDGVAHVDCELTPKRR